jgi:hypothetical protein
MTRFSEALWNSSNLAVGRLVAGIVLVEVRATVLGALWPGT